VYKLHVQPAERNEKYTINDNTKRPKTIIIRQGIAPWRGISDAGVEALDFFLIFAEPIARRLLLEQAIESGAGIAGVARRGRVLHQSVRGSGRHGVAGHGKYGRKEFAGIGLIFDGNAGRHRLVALKARGGIKMDALFTAMQSRPAFGAVSSKIGVRRQSHGATKAA
jgi:hypothetical protein